MLNLLLFLFVDGANDIHFVWCEFSCVSSSTCRGWQCAQQLVLSCTKEQRKSQQPFWKEEG